MKPKEKTFGVNCSLKKSTVGIIEGYMNKTRKNFSQTLNIIVAEWDEFSIAIQKFRAEQQLKQMQKAQVVKEL